MGSDQIDSRKILFFHGFWGLPSDWSFLESNGFLKSYLAVDYLKIESLGPDNFISDWGQNFIEWKYKNIGNVPIKAVGYSQGGRLLMQALAAAPQEFEKLVLISSHPGLINFSDKESRLISDRQWSKKFRHLDWGALQTEWDSQGVFVSKPSPNRAEADFNRELLALCLENWSLAHQSNMRDVLNTYADKIQIILGEQDTKYMQLYRDFFKESSHLKMEKGAAHRVPFDQPISLVKTLNLLFS